VEFHWNFSRISDIRIWLWKFNFSGRKLWTSEAEEYIIVILEDRKKESTLHWQIRYRWRGSPWKPNFQGLHFLSP
jgi:hypothetical protein